MAEKQVRRKTLTFDGYQVVIAPLTFAQVDDLTDKETGGIKVNAFNLVVDSLNNALGANPADEQKWNVERVKAEMDPWLVDKLKEEILAFTGLAVTSTEEKKPGEELAASVKR